MATKQLLSQIKSTNTPTVGQVATANPASDELIWDDQWTTASSVSIADAWWYYTSTDVEGALQEIWSNISSWVNLSYISSSTLTPWSGTINTTINVPVPTWTKCVIITATTTASWWAYAWETTIYEIWKTTWRFYYWQGAWWTNAVAASFVWTDIQMQFTFAIQLWTFTFYFYS